MWQASLYETAYNPRLEPNKKRGHTNDSTFPSVPSSSSANHGEEEEEGGEGKEGDRAVGSYTARGGQRRISREAFAWLFGARGRWSYQLSSCLPLLELLPVGVVVVGSK